jgi:putative acetyltransferase
MSSINPFIAETDGVIAGYSDLQSSGLIDHFFCHHNYQGCGVGKALMSHIFE